MTGEILPFLKTIETWNDPSLLGWVDSIYESTSPTKFSMLLSQVVHLKHGLSWVEMSFTYYGPSYIGHRRFLLFKLLNNCG